jgi:hypothetical protein
MTTLPINQAVDVHWQLPSAQKPDGRIEGDEVVRTFDNLIPACEFAVAMAKSRWRGRAETSRRTLRSSKSRLVAKAASGSRRAAAGLE